MRIGDEELAMKRDLPGDAELAARPVADQFAFMILDTFDRAEHLGRLTQHYPTWLEGILVDTFKCGFKGGAFARDRLLEDLRTGKIVQDMKFALQEGMSEAVPRELLSKRISDLRQAEGSERVRYSEHAVPEESHCEPDCGHGQAQGAAWDGGPQLQDEAATSAHHWCWNGRSQGGRMRRQEESQDRGRDAADHPGPLDQEEEDGQAAH